MIKNDYHFKMSTKNYVVDSVISSKNPVVENLTMGIRNFKVSSSGLIIRTVDSYQEFTFTFNQLSSVDIIHLNGTNLLVGATIQVIGYKGTDVVYDSGVQQFLTPKPLGDYGNEFGLVPLGGYYISSGENTNHTTILEAPIIMSSVVIKVSSVNQTYIDISKVLISSLFSPISNNISYGMSITYQNNNSVQRTLSGAVFVSLKFTIKVITLTLERYTDEDRIKLSDIFRSYVGTPMFITCFPTYGGSLETEYSGMYIMTGSPSISHPVYGRFDSSSLTFEEI